ncbi:hypothetical protein [Streptomyces sp. NPDC007355]|uniref:hypothetical protein n=1 Tax=Streptomyces sp. NPDC007355 TaxID=3364778 RepID=UPI0036B4E9ED
MRSGDNDEVVAEIAEVGGVVTAAFTVQQTLGGAEDAETQTGDPEKRMQGE